MNQLRKYIIAGLVVFLFVINFVLMPNLHKKKATSIVEEILLLWDKGDSASGVTYWYDREKFPPIYNMVSSKIIGKSFGKKNGKKNAVFFIDMNFTQGNVLPSGKTWVCEMNDTEHGWKVTSFYIQPTR